MSKTSRTGPRSISRDNIKRRDIKRRDIKRRNIKQGNISRGIFESLESRTFLSVTSASIVPHLAVTPAVGAGVSVAPARGTGLTAEYFDQVPAFTNPVAVTAASNVNAKWAFGRPLNVIPAGAPFSVSWTGQVAAPTTGTYTFYALYSEGVARVIVNGQTVIDFSSSVPTGLGLHQQSGQIAMTAGTKVSIEVDFQHSVLPVQSPQIHLYWSAPGISKRIVPASVLFPSNTTLPASALTGYYFSGQNFNKLQVVEDDTTIHFNQANVADIRFPQGSPLSVRWIGYFTPTVTGQYTLLTNTDDGARVWVDGKLLINKWYPQVSSDTHSAKIDLTAGQSYALRMDYFGNSILPTTAELQWIVPGAKHPVLLPFNLNAVAPANAPTNVTATATSSTEIDVNWNAVDGATNYEVLRSTGSQPFTLYGTTGGQTTFPDVTVTPGTTYSYEIIATNDAGQSPASAPATATTPAQSGVPAAPVIVSSGPNPGPTISIGWNGVTGATGYILERSDNGTTGFATVDNTTTGTFTDTNVSYNSTYYYRVTAINSVGSSAPSAVVSVPTPPAPPTLTASVASATEIDLNWNNVAGNDGYIVEESLNGQSFTAVNAFTSSTMNPFRTVGTDVTSLQVGGLNSSTKYYFKVIAENASDGSESNVVFATTSVPNPVHSPITEMYGLTNGGTVYAINTSNGAVAQIGSLSFGTNAGARDPVSGNLYYFSTGQSNVAVSTWNPFDSVNTPLNAGAPLGNPVAQAAFRDDGQLFVTTDMGQLFSINSISGVATFDGTLTLNASTLLTGNGDIAFAPDKTMFIETNSTIYTVSNAAINGANGGSSLITVTQVGPTNTSNLQIAFGQNSVLYGMNAAGQLYTINTTTGAATAVGAASGIAMGDLASTPLYGNLAVTQTASAFVRNSTGTYTINVSNTGPDSTVGPTTLVDVLPTGITPTSITGTGWAASLSGQTLTLTYVSNIVAGASAPTITLTVGVGASAANSVSNSVTASTTEFETSLANNVSTISTSVTG